LPLQHFAGRLGLLSSRSGKDQYNFKSVRTSALDGIVTDANVQCLTSYLYMIGKPLSGGQKIGHFLRKRYPSEQLDEEILTVWVDLKEHVLAVRFETEVDRAVNQAHAVHEAQ